MMSTVLARIAALLACVFFATAASADTIYKYRRSDGRTVYSNRLELGLELIETFEYRFTEQASGPKARAGSQSDAEDEARIRNRLDTLQAAWTEVQEAMRGLEAAEERLRTELTPQTGEREAVASAPAPYAPPPPPPEVGGPISLPRSVGGVPAPALPSVGGPMSGRRGRASPGYVARMEVLEAEVRTARERLDMALRNYNQLR